MKWNTDQIARLRELAGRNAPNKEIASELGCEVSDIYAKRSQLGITRAKLGFGSPSASAPYPIPQPRKLPRRIMNALKVLHAQFSGAANGENVDGLVELWNRISDAVKLYEAGQ